MKLTKTKLRQLIKEELNKVLNEDDWGVTDEREIAARESGAKQKLLQNAREAFEKEMDSDADWFGWDDVEGEVGEPIEVLRAKIAEWAAVNGAGDLAQTLSTQGQ
jgi:hypothetical protein